jgi:hypothetical protein
LICQEGRAPTTPIRTVDAENQGLLMSPGAADVLEYLDEVNKQRAGEILPRRIIGCQHLDLQLRQVIRRIEVMHGAPM